MEYEEINRLVFKALECLSPIATSRVSMFDLNNKHLPFLRFRFKGKSKQDSIYEQLRTTIENFKGNLKWSLTVRDWSENYIIMPSFLNMIDEDKFLNQEDYYISILGEEAYNRKVEEAILDIPQLAQAISSCC